MRTLETSEINKAFELAINGEPVIISNHSSHSAVLLSHEEYKALKNAEYSAMLEQSMQQARNGEIIIKTLDELKAMEK